MWSPPSEPPGDEQELLARAHALAGHTLGEIAAQCEQVVPDDLRRAKGWVGLLLERALGATSGNAPVPDFLALGVELKTLPVNELGDPTESTYVSMVPLKGEPAQWTQSSVFRKLEKVLWVPILATEPVIANRAIGRSVLWSPSASQWETLRSDWASHLQTIADGYVDAIDGRDGAVLQIRPKGARASARAWTVDPDGNEIMTQPRGFYLRPAFTRQILMDAFER